MVVNLTHAFLRSFSDILGNGRQSNMPFIDRSYLTQIATQMCMHVHTYHKDHSFLGCGQH